jgi:hypothetical protein
MQPFSQINRDQAPVPSCLRWWIVPRCMVPLIRIARRRKQSPYGKRFPSGSASKRIMYHGPFGDIRCDRPNEEDLPRPRSSDVARKSATPVTSPLQQSSILAVADLLHLRQLSCQPVVQ